jgi:hypothetical protein
LEPRVHHQDSSARTSPPHASEREHQAGPTARGQRFLTAATTTTATTTTPMVLGRFVNLPFCQLSKIFMGRRDKLRLMVQGLVLV